LHPFAATASALRSLIYGMAIAGLWMSIVLCLTYYGKVTQYSPTDFSWRISNFAAMSLRNNPLGEKPQYYGVPDRRQGAVR